MNATTVHKKNFLKNLLIKMDLNVLVKKNVYFKIKGEGNGILKSLKKYRYNLLFFFFTFIFLNFKLNPFHIQSLHLLKSLTKKIL